MLYFHANTEQIIRVVTANLPQGILLTGLPGVGLFTVGQAIAGESVIAVLHPKNSNDEPNKQGSISIETVRDLYQYARAKQNKQATIIIRDADKMTVSAQNAFLKLLEEPSSHLHFILTAHNSAQLLPTILSRVQIHTINPISQQQSISLLDDLNVTDTTKQQQLLFMASGLPAALHHFSSDENLFENHVQLIKDARSFLTETPYQKLVITQKYHNDRAKTLALLRYCTKLVRHNMKKHASKSHISQLNKLIITEEAIARNYNSKLQLTRFVL